MTEQEIIEGNKIIAEFMDYTNNYWYQNNCLTYHSSWDKLMPVVEKISRFEYDRHEQELPFGGTEIVINTADPRTFGMLSSEGKPMVRFNGCILFIAETLIEATYLAVIDFINKESLPE